MVVPWPKYYQVALPVVGTAMENISLVAWSDSYLLDERLAKEDKIHGALRINIHEMGSC